MEVIIPGSKNNFKNIFFDEVMKLSEFNFIFKNWNEINTDEDFFILFHWPEIIFNGIEPTLNQLLDFERKLKVLKRKSTILYLVHNTTKHTGTTKIYRELYKIIEHESDIMIHFGLFSQGFYQEKYALKKHVIIKHPLYSYPFKLENKCEVRTKLDIPQDRIVIIAPGQIRNFKERNLVLRFFKYFPEKRKTLIIPYMKRRVSNIDFKGRIWLKKIIDIKKIHESFLNFYPQPKYFFNYEFNSSEKLSLLMNASDIVIIPRLKILNSGNVFLAMTFRKLMVGPNQGNLQEELIKFNCPVFNPKDNQSVKAAAIQIHDKIKSGAKLNEALIKEYNPTLIANQWDSLLMEIINSKIKF